jgi:hypothetical protein
VAAGDGQEAAVGGREEAAVTGDVWYVKCWVGVSERAGTCACG